MSSSSMPSPPPPPLLFNNNTEEELSLSPPVGWKPFNHCRPSLLPHPSEVHNDLFSSSYAFPPTEVTPTAPWTTNSTNTNTTTTYSSISSVPMLPEVSEEPFYREQRSMSYSFGHNDLLFSPTPNSHHHHHHHYPFLSSIMQQVDEEEEEPQDQSCFIRTRSKSSAAIMDIWNPTSSSTSHQVWGGGGSAFNTSFIQQPTSMRRFSLAPSSMALLVDNNNNHSTLLNQRRHSLAGPTSRMMNSIMELESLAIGEQSEIIDLPTTGDDMGKGTRLDSEILKNNATFFYVVEFKGGRSDVFYSQLLYKKNELVIVEADRGRDLGKIVKENITRKQLEYFYTLLKNVNHHGEEEEKESPHIYQANEIYVKCIFRSAKNDEITLFMAKGQDELKALVVCQSKIKQKKLNMQVVDAEYQWDRRKLTFYFIAEKRVDFRELVRELFKLYKTRIWMCAMNSIKVLQ